jgi:cell division septation protein DedD
VAHKMVSFRLHRIGVILLIVGSLFLAVLIFAAGYLAGMKRGAVNIAKPKVPAIPTIALPTLPTAAKPAVAASAGPSSAASTSSASTDESLALRVGAFISEEDAKASVQQLAVYKLQGVIVPVAVDGGPLYTVQVGHYTSREAAAKAAEKMEKEHGLQAAVVPAP